MFLKGPLDSHTITPQRNLITDTRIPCGANVMVILILTGICLTHHNDVSTQCSTLFHPNMTLHKNFTDGLPCMWEVGMGVIRQILASQTVLKKTLDKPEILEENGHM